MSAPAHVGVLELEIQVQKNQKKLVMQSDSDVAVESQYQQGVFVKAPVEILAELLGMDISNVIETPE